MEFSQETLKIAVIQFIYRGIPRKGQNTRAFRKESKQISIEPYSRVAQPERAPHILGGAYRVH